jgi:hypothetical protein
MRHVKFVQLVAGHFAQVAGADGAVRVELGTLVKKDVALRSVQRGVDQLKEAGVIDGARGRYRILDMVRLQTLASGDMTRQDDTPTRHAKTTRNATRHAKAGIDYTAQLEGLREGLAAVASEVTRLSEALSGEVTRLSEALAAGVVEVVSLRAEVAALRSSVASSAPALPAPTLDVDALVGRIVDALRVTLPATSPPAAAEGVAVNGRGSLGVVDDLEALKQLVSRVGGNSGAARLIGGITEGGVRRALNKERVSPKLAERVWVALASLDAAEG